MKTIIHLHSFEEDICDTRLSFPDYFSSDYKE